MSKSIGRVIAGLFCAMWVMAPAGAFAVPAFVEHIPSNQVFGEPANITQRTPPAPREDEVVRVYFKTGPSFTYDAVAVYYTTDGSEPQGSAGTTQPGTSVLVNYGPSPAITFLRNEPGQSGNDDWWVAVFPAFTREYDVRVRYKVSAWETSNPNPEVFAGGGATFEWTNLLAWPGKGAPYPDHTAGYPPYYSWKEEGVVGNNYMNVQLDQNGAVYDIYYPSAGCVRGMGTKNEGYVNGADTFPPMLPPGNRGQMNLNQAMCGIRVNDTTYWFTNENAAGYSDVDQSYIPGTNVIQTSQRLTAGGENIDVQQYDYCPKGITYPTDDGGAPNRGLYIKRVVLTNNGASARTVNFYCYADFALNGGDGFDGMFTDAPRGAMVAYDNTQRFTSSSGEYNPTSGIGDYNKNVSVYLATAMRLSNAVGGGSGSPATDFWSDTSSDQGMGWIGMQVELPVGVSKEVAVLFVGGFDDFAGASGTYDYQMDNAIDWFLSQDLDALQQTTEDYWSDWLASGVTVDTPDEDYDTVFARGLLATALHLDGKNGGVIAGMHNGAYPFVWPRDAAWAAITLDRTGHTAESDEVYRFLREIAYRAEEEPGRKGWWYQKYTTDGHIVWSAPQVDETSAFTWGAYYHYLVTGDVQFLADNYVTVYEAGRAMSEDSNIDNRIYYDDTFDLMYSNNLWEDAFDLFIYSNASVERGLRDAAAIADVLDQNVCPGGPGTCNYHNDKALFESRANEIHGGLTARLIWDGENTDISHLGLVYPFEVYDSKDPLVEHVVDRMNGVATDTIGNNHPIVNFSGEWEGLINRYWGDGYWNNPGAPNPNASPWYLTTMWYGCYYAERQDANPGKGDIDNHKYRMDLLLDRLGPIGFGAEQIAPFNSLLIPGETDFLLQTAWPNAWESMSFFADAVMIFLDYTPDAPGNTLRIAPNLPSAWPWMTFNNLALGDHRVDVACSETAAYNTHTFTNRTGMAVDYETYVRVPAPTAIFAVAENGVAVGYDHDATLGRVRVAGDMATGAMAETQVRVYFGTRGDADGDGDVDIDDYPQFPPCMTGPEGSATPECAVYDFDVDGDVDLEDFHAFTAVFSAP